MTSLRTQLEELAGKAIQGPWAVEEDPYGDPFPGITEQGSPFEFASFTLGEDADVNQARVDLVVALVNNLPTILAALDAVEWRSIETGPRDGTRILVGCFKAESLKFGRVHVDRWHSGSPDHYTGWGRFNENYFPATHWRPLGPLPEGE